MSDTADTATEPAAEPTAEPPAEAEREEFIRRVKELRAQDRKVWTYRKIAEELGSSKAAVGRVFTPERPRKRRKRRRWRKNDGTQEVIEAVAAAVTSEVRGLVPDDPAPLLRSLKKRLASHPAVVDLDYLPNRLRRLIDRCVAAVEVSLDGGTLKEQVGALKYAVEMYVQLSLFDRGIVTGGRGASAAVQVNVGQGGAGQTPDVTPDAYAALTNSQLLDVVGRRRAEAAAALGVDASKLPPLQLPAKGKVKAKGSR